MARIALSLVLVIAWSGIAVAQAPAPAGTPLAPTAPVAVPLRPAPGVNLGQTLRRLDQDLAAIGDHPTPEKIDRASQSLSAMRYNTLYNAIIVGNPIGPIQDILAEDETYQKNFATLASLHLRSTQQRPQPGLPMTRETPVSFDGGNSNLRIVGDSAPMRRSFVMRVFANTKYVCTGILVSQDTVLTALHCNCSDDGRITRVQYIDAGGHTQNGVVKAIFSLIDDSSDQKTMCKPGPNGSPYDHLPLPVEAKGHDIVLLKLQDQIDENEASAVPVVAKAGQLNAARAAIVSGFGATSPTSKKFVGTGWAPATAIALAGVSSCADCGAGEFPAGPSPVIGTYRARGNDTCNGDSGGPLFLFEKAGVENAVTNGQLTIDYLTSKVTLVLAGTTSRGLTSTSTCGQGGIYEMLDTSWTMAALKHHDVPVVSVDDFIPF